MAENHKDIFDRIMSLRIFAPLNPFYMKHKEVLMYLFFGGLTFIVSIASYAICVTALQMNALVANIISWVLAVLFAYITNRTWVFTDKAHTVKGIGREIAAFFTGRLVTFGLEELILLVFVTILNWNSIGVKTVAQVIVIVSNYIISKMLVFRK